MWFRNLLIYRLTQPIDTTASALESALASKPARPCASQELTTYGFAPPVGKGDAPLVREANGFWLICCRKEEKILPGSVVNEALKEKVEEIEETQQRKVYKKERDQLKDEIVQTLLPRAFTRRKRTFAAIMPAQGLVIVDTATAKAAEDLLSTLREALGSLPVRPIATKVSPTATMTEWLRSQETNAGGDFWLCDGALLRDTDEQGSITAKHQDLTSDVIRQHLDSGKSVTKLALAWKKDLYFVLDEGLVIRSLRFDDLLQERALDDAGTDSDEFAQADASFVLMMLTFREFIPQLLEALGGEEFPQGIDGAHDEPEPAPGAGINVTKALGMRDGITATLHIPQANGPGDDPLLKEAIRFVHETRRASISAIQRKLKIGYNRAARLVEEMELLDIVGPMKGDGSREVLS
ncbi:recombination-associated protein RdgC [Pseudomonas aeruginosa]|nr:recombination-associated protein RdgC [Pseudomonas aeruginosa]RUE61660.1 recombination-associated protein RdgC [Pseudomonas aeruginosa]